MKKSLILLFLTALFYTAAFAQKQLSYGLFFNSALTTFADFSNAENQASSMDYGIKPSLGGGILINYAAAEKFDLQLSAGFMQRGTLFAQGEAKPAPRYKLNYLDFMLGINYKPKPTGFNFGTGISQHTLLGANRYNFHQRDYIGDDFSNIDLGVYLSAGYDLPIGPSSMWFKVLLNGGLLNVYSGVLSQNDLNSRNVMAGLQLGYIIGRTKKE
jgi:hypothetical protein